MQCRHLEAVALTIWAILPCAAIAGEITVPAKKSPGELVVFARSYSVRMRAHPDLRSAALPVSLLGAGIRVRAEHGDWLDASWGWLRREEVVAADEAEELFSAELSRTPAVFAYLGRASALVLNKEFDRARSDINEALRICPNCARAYFVLAGCAREQLLADEAYAHLDHAVQLDCEDPVALAVRGRLFVARNDFYHASVDFKTAAARLPGLAAIHRDFGEAWFRKRQYDRALAEYDLAVCLDPGDAYAHVGRGEARHALQQLNGAVADLTEAIHLDSKLSKPFVSRGCVRASQGDYQLAFADFDEAIRLDPKRASAYVNRGIAKVRQRRYDEALVDFRRGIKLAPDEPVPHVECATVLNAKGFYYNAIAEADKALRLDPNSVQALYQRAFAFSHVRPQRAVEDLSSVLRGEPTNAAALAIRACAWGELGDWVRAIEDANAALRLDARCKNALMARAYARMHRAEYQLAKDDCATFISLDPAQPEVWEYRGICQQHLGNLQGAVADYQESLRIKPKQSRVLSELRLAQRELHATDGVNWITSLFRQTARGPAPSLR